MSSKKIKIQIMENLKNITSEEKIFSVSIAEALNSANSNLQVEQAESEKKISSEAPIKAPAKEEELSFSAYSKVTLQRTGAGRGGKWYRRIGNIDWLRKAWQG